MLRWQWDKEAVQQVPPDESEMGVRLLERIVGHTSISQAYSNSQDEA